MVRRICYSKIKIVNGTFYFIMVILYMGNEVKGFVME